MTTLQPLRGRTPTATRQSSILDPSGRPVTRFLYDTPRSNPKAYKPRGWLSPDTKVNISEYDRSELVNYSRQIFAQMDPLNAAVNTKNNWAFGDAWDYHYSGTNEAWGEEAENFINNQFFPNCNVRGPLYDFKKSLLLSGMAWDVDGDDAMVLTSTPAGFPQLAFYPATKISSRGNFETSNRKGPVNTVQGGEFDGATITDGIIFDRNCRAIGIRIVGDDGTYTDVSSYHCDLAYEPQWSDQGRGIPKAAVGLLRWMDIQDIDGFIRRGLKRASSVGLLQKTEDGEAPNENELEVDETVAGPDGAKAARKVVYDEIEGGETYWLSSTAGDSIEQLDYKNPHPNVEAYIERITRGCLASIGWYIELLDLGSTGRAPSRILCDLANQSIWSRQKTGYRRAVRAISYAIGLGMKNGLLSRNNDGHDAYLFELGLPKPISVDAGNEAAADREALKLGLTTRQIVMQKWHGLHYRAVNAQRAKELGETFAAARALSKEYPEVSFDRSLELLEQRSPNPIAQLPKTKEQTQQQGRQSA